MIIGLDISGHNFVELNMENKITENICFDNIECGGAEILETRIRMTSGGLIANNHDSEALDPESVGY